MPGGSVNSIDNSGADSIGKRRSAALAEPTRHATVRAPVRPADLFFRREVLKTAGTGRGVRLPLRTGRGKRGCAPAGVALGWMDMLTFHRLPLWPIGNAGDQAEVNRGVGFRLPMRKARADSDPPDPALLRQIRTRIVGGLCISWQLSATAWSILGACAPRR